MNKKTILIIIALIAIIIVGFIAYNQFNNQKNQVTLENCVFTLPNGYHEGTSQNGEINITNGLNTLKIVKYNDNNVKKHVNDYKSYKEKSNYSISVSNFTVNNITIYKSNIVNDTNYLHYWFVYEGKVYSISTEDGNKNMDSIITELVRSIK